METGTYFSIICLFCVWISQSNTTVVRKYAGEDAMLSCELNGTFPRWYGLNAVEIPPMNTSETKSNMKSQPFYCKNKHDLCLTDLRTYDSGHYKCETKNGFSHVTLNVTQRKISTKQTEIAGDDVQLTCDFNKSLPYWYGPEYPQIPLVRASTTTFNPNTKLVKENRLSYCSNKRELCIKDVKTYDAGVYMCIWLGIGEHTITLSVSERNTVSQQSEIAGDDVMITCARNNSLPYWYGPEFPQTPLVHAGETSFNPNSTLVKESRLTYCANKRDLCIKDLKTYDKGVYKCTWIGVGNHTITLSVTEVSGNIWIYAMIPGIVMPIIMLIMFVVMVKWKLRNKHSSGENEPDSNGSLQASQSDQLIAKTTFVSNDKLIENET